MADLPSPSSEQSSVVLSEASPQELADALAYALRYDDRGKPRPSGGQLVASLAAERLVQHLARSGYVVMKRPPSRLHSAG